MSQNATVKKVSVDGIELAVETGILDDFELVECIADSTDDTADGNVRLQAAAYYSIDRNGKIVQYVHDYDRAWACGDGIGTGKGNDTTISIEHANNARGPWTVYDATLEAGARWTAALCRAYGLGRPEWMKNVFPHKHWSATSCPGELAGSQNDKFMVRARWWYDDMAGAREAVDPPKLPPPDALNGFKDLDSIAWYIQSLEEAVKKGYVHGYPNGSMGPNDPLARGQAVCFIANATDVEFDEPFSDVTASPFYYNAVKWAEEQGIVSGNVGEFRSDDACLRCEFVAMLYNWRGEKVEGYEPKEFSDWGDVRPWAKEAMAWAVKTGVLSGANGKLLSNDKCSCAEGATMLVNLLK